MENVLDAVRAGQLDLRHPLVDVLFRCIDRLESMMTRLREDQDYEITEEDQAFVDWLDRELSQAMGAVVHEVVETINEGTTSEVFVETESPESLVPSRPEDSGVTISEPIPTIMDASDSNTASELAEERNERSTKEIAVSESVEEVGEIEDDPAIATFDTSEGSMGREDIFDVSKYLSLYLDEADEEIDGLNESLLKFEKNSSDLEALAEVFRMAHRLKGASAAMGFHEVKELTHQIETYFDQIRDGDRTLDERTVNAIFASVDVLREYHRDLRAGKADATVLNRQTQYIMEVITPSAELITEESFIEEPEPCLLPEWDERVTGHRVRITFDPSLSYSSLKAALVLHRIETSGEVVGSHPSMADLESADKCLKLTVDVATTQSADVVRRWVDVDGVLDVTIETHQTTFEHMAEHVEQSAIVDTPSEPVLLMTQTNQTPVTSTPKSVEKAATQKGKESPHESNGGGKAGGDAGRNRTARSIDESCGRVGH